MAQTSSEAGGKTQTLGRVTFLDGQSELPMLEVSTPWSTAEIYLHGAHVTNFTRRGEAPLLFMSRFSRFEPEQPIRGGIPIVFPWFGPREGLPQHGFARLKAWEVKEVSPAANGSVSVRFCLPEYPEASTGTEFRAEYTVTVDQGLRLKLAVTNQSKDESFTFENCLHSYFEVGDVTAISIKGLAGTAYLDKVANFAQKTEAADPLRISTEVDRVYLNSTGTVEVIDPRLSRKILIEKQASLSTVVWNPWVAKSQQMPDFGNDEYLRMICIESGNVGSNQITLPPGETSTLIVRLKTEALA